jgi:hypothetical protein
LDAGGFLPAEEHFLLLALYRLRPRRLLAAILREMKEQRIAVLTYHKFPGELWPEQEFRSHQLVLLICNYRPPGDFRVYRNVPIGCSANAGPFCMTILITADLHYRD